MFSVDKTRISLTIGGNASNIWREKQEEVGSSKIK